MITQTEGYRHDGVESADNTSNGRTCSYLSDEREYFQIEDDYEYLNDNLHEITKQNEYTKLKMPCNFLDGQSRLVKSLGNFHNERFTNDNVCSHIVLSKTF